jgi:hypothetical protein
MNNSQNPDSEKKPAIKSKYTRDNTLKLRPTQNHFIHQNASIWTQQDVGILVKLIGFVRHLKSISFPENKTNLKND